MNTTSYPEAMYAGKLGETQKELTELAILIAKDNSIDLDFSHSSIENVEAILAAIHDMYQQTNDDNGLNGIALEFGFYIAATIQNTTGTGHLEANHPEYGDSTFPFYWNDSTIFTYGWCEKRIFDGPNDNIIPKYKTFVLDNLEAS